jgi:molybdate transport system substrate-binding protein
VHALVRRTVVPAAAFALGAAGCGGSGSAGSTGTTSTKQTVTGSITVSAAASLTQVLAKIGRDFEATNPDASVRFNFGSSSTLETQLEQGAPADAFASADAANMDKAVAAGLVDGTPSVFARNRLVIVTKPGNPEHVHTIADLANLGTVALCATTVPCGKYAQQILQRAGVRIPESRITRGQDVKATLAAVTTGDADGAIVYVTDARTADDTVTTVSIPDEQNAIAVYPVAVLESSGNTATARAFIAYVTSETGQATLHAAGFLPPS